MPGDAGRPPRAVRDAGTDVAPDAGLNVESDAVGARPDGRLEGATGCELQPVTPSESSASEQAIASCRNMCDSFGAVVLKSPVDSIRRRCQV
jgi:hypothetical protein